MDKELRDTAADNFDRASRGTLGEAELQTIALGLMQLARALRHDCADTPLMDVAARNFDAVRSWQGERQASLMALGLAQFTRAL